MNNLVATALAAMQARALPFVRSPSALFEGIAARKKLTIEFISGISIRDVLVTGGLLLLLLMSAIGVVYSSHMVRQLFAEHAQLLEQKDHLQLEWAQLLLEQSAWSAPTRIENVAREELQMVLPPAEQVELIGGDR